MNKPEELRDRVWETLSPVINSYIEKTGVYPKVITMNAWEWFEFGMKDKLYATIHLERALLQKRGEYLLTPTPEELHKSTFKSKMDKL